MSSRITRRDLLRLGTMAGGAALLASCKQPAEPAKPTAPALISNAQPQWDLSDPATVGLALRAEGAEVSISSWGFSGLPETHFKPKLPR